VAGSGQRAIAHRTIERATAGLQHGTAVAHPKSKIRNNVNYHSKKTAGLLIEMWDEANMGLIMPQEPRSAVVHVSGSTIVSI